MLAHRQAQQQRQRQQQFFWEKWPGAKLADDAAPRRYFEQGMHQIRPRQQLRTETTIISWAWVGGKVHQL